MKKYYIHDGQKQIGPFSAIELLERGITKCTPVYTAGLGRYVCASEIPVLNDAFGKSIEELKNPALSLPDLKKNNPLLPKLLWAVGVLLIILIPYIIYRAQTDVADAPISAPAAAVAVNATSPMAKTSLQQKEAANPMQYLSVHGKMHRNLVGKKIIKGTITNLASLSGYKNMEMAITFLSGNHTELQTQLFYVNDIVAPNGAIAFRNVFNAPAETAGFQIKVISAITSM